LLAVMTAAVIAIVLLPWGETEAPTPQIEEPEAPAPVASATPDELFAQGTALFEEDRIAEAIDLWEQAVVADPDNASFRERYGEVLYRVGYIYQGAGRLEQAREAWQRLIDHLPDHQMDESVIKARSRLRGMTPGR
jgi:tetratricopeptide (TPR) repeat protein